MPIPSQEDIKYVLLHFIQSRKGKIKPQESYVSLAKYFKLTEEELQMRYPKSGEKIFYNRIQWARNMLVKEGLLDKSDRGIWKITQRGIEKVQRMQLTDNPFINEGENGLFDNNIQEENDYIFYNKVDKNVNEDENLIQLAICEIRSKLKKFPEDFIDNSISDFYEVETPNCLLGLSDLSKSTIVSKGNTFRYLAKHPTEAKYILYAHKKGKNKIKIPKGNREMFNMVCNYEKHLKEVEKELIDFFINRTYDDKRANFLKDKTKELLIRWDSPYR